MARTCAWCDSVTGTFGASGAPSLRGAAPDTQPPVSHVLCSGCLEDLRTALAAQSLRSIEIPVTSARTSRRAA